MVKVITVLFSMWLSMRPFTKTKLCYSDNAVTNVTKTYPFFKIKNLSIYSLKNITPLTTKLVYHDYLLKKILTPSIANIVLSVLLIPSGPSPFHL